MNTDRSEMMRCAEPSRVARTPILLLVDGCGVIQRAYIDTTMKGQRVARSDTGGGDRADAADGEFRPPPACRSG